MNGEEMREQVDTHQEVLAAAQLLNALPSKRRNSSHSSSPEKSTQIFYIHIDASKLV